MADARRSSPAALRNREPIGDVLAGELPDEGTVLEIASGSGEHALYLAQRFGALMWQPSDPQAEARASIAAYRDGANRDGAALANLAEPDASAEEWPIDRADAILCVNMIHISPWSAGEGLFAGAAQLLPSGGPLILYGPFLEAGVETAPSNLAFDDSLKARDPEWGLRDTADVGALAAGNGFVPSRRVAMPANNLMVVYRKT